MNSDLCISLISNLIEACYVLRLNFNIYTCVESNTCIAIQPHTYLKLNTAHWRLQFHVFNDKIYSISNWRGGIQSLIPKIYFRIFQMLPFESKPWSIYEYLLATAWHIILKSPIAIIKIYIRIYICICTMYVNRFKIYTRASFLLHNWRLLEKKVLYAHINDLCKFIRRARFDDALWTWIEKHLGSYKHIAQFLKCFAQELYNHHRENALKKWIFNEG